VTQKDPRQLAAALGTSTEGVARTVGALVRRGLVERRRAGSVFHRLAPAGSQLGRVLRRAANDMLTASIVTAGLVALIELASDRRRRRALNARVARHRPAVRALPREDLADLLTLHEAGLGWVDHEATR
jgi:DNA-binding transcriptional MocR family regulator